MNNAALKNIFKSVVVVCIIIAFFFVIGEPVEDSFFGIIVVKGAALAVMAYGCLTLRRIDKTFDDEDV